MPAPAMEGVHAEGQHAGLGVHVGPAEPEQFALAHPGGRR
jgi:hypothetical protein